MRQSHRHGSWSLATGLVVIALGFAAPARAEVTLPHSFTAGNTISASQVNENFAAIAAPMPAATSMYSYTNGNLYSTDVEVIRLSVTPPADGFLVVSATAQFTVAQTASGTDGVSAELVMTPSGGSSQSSVQSLRFGVTTSSGTTQTITNSLAPTYAFPVTGGVVHALAMKARKTGAGSAAVTYQYGTMSVLFVPNKLPCSPPPGTGSYGPCTY